MDGEGGLSDELALLHHYNGYRTDFRTVDDDTVLYLLGQMRRATLLLKLREEVS
jgi:hypothetical protein